MEKKERNQLEQTDHQTLTEQMQELNRQLIVKRIQETNRYTEQFGLTLTKEDAELLVTERTNTLKAERRVEFGESILPKIIDAFCDSAYIRQAEYTKTLLRLQEIFYRYKNETMDEVTDDELLHFMKRKFETVCRGDLDYLEGTCLELFAQEVRGGYRGYQKW